MTLIWNQVQRGWILSCGDSICMHAVIDTLDKVYVIWLYHNPLDAEIKYSLTKEIDLDINIETLKAELESIVAECLDQ